MAGAFRGQLALGTRLSGEGGPARLTGVLAALIALGFAVFAARVARRDGATSLADAVALSSTALAWGAGLIFVLGAATQGMARDRARGVSALYRLHGVSQHRYLAARALGLGVQLVRMVALGSLFVALVGAAAAPRMAPVLAAARGWASCLVYALAFALVVAPLATAAGAFPSASANEVRLTPSAARRGRPERPHGRGGLVLVLVLVLPAVVRLATIDVLDSSWRSVLGVPAALSALRALVLGGGDRLLALHAALVLLAIGAFGVVLLRSRMGMRRRAGSAEDGAW